LPVFKDFFVNPVPGMQTYDLYNFSFSNHLKAKCVLISSFITFANKTVA